MSLTKWIELTSFIDPRGQLVVAEVDRHIPFPIKRVYFMRDLKGDEPRGFHAHRALEQVAVCVAGRCSILLDDGQKREEVILSEPNRGLTVESMVWHEMSNFSADCVLMVFASEVFDESDYIRNYSDFLAEVM